jgi:hypothetical protein
MRILAFRVRQIKQFDHPPLKIEIRNHEELQALNNKVCELFEPIKKKYGVEYDLVRTREPSTVALIIGDQPTQEAAHEVSRAKGDLDTFALDYTAWSEMPDWQKVLFGITKLFLKATWFILARLIRFLHRKLKERFTWTDAQASWAVFGILSACILLLIMIGSLSNLGQSRPTYQSNQQSQSQISQESNSGGNAVEREDETATVTSDQVQSGVGQSTFNLSSFPRESCGDTLPEDPGMYPLDFYPVYVAYGNQALSIIQDNFCKDAYQMKRESTNERSIQVASFVGRERAEDFQEFLIEQVGNAEIGEPTTYEEAPG